MKSFDIMKTIRKIRNDEYNALYNKTPQEIIAYFNNLNAFDKNKERGKTKRFVP